MAEGKAAALPVQSSTLPHCHPHQLDAAASATPCSSICCSCAVCSPTSQKALWGTVPPPNRWTCMCILLTGNAVLLASRHPLTIVCHVQRRPQRRQRRPGGSGQARRRQVSLGTVTKAHLTGPEPELDVQTQAQAYTMRCMTGPSLAGLPGLKLVLLQPADWRQPTTCGCSIGLALAPAAALWRRALGVGGSPLVPV